MYCSGGAGGVRPPDRITLLRMSASEDEVARLRDTIRNLETAVEHRDVIGQAKGVIMATRRCSAEEAFALLIEQSQHTNRRVIDIATELAASQSQGGPPGPLFEPGSG